MNTLCSRDLNSNAEERSKNVDRKSVAHIESFHLRAGFDLFRERFHLVPTSASFDRLL